MTGFLLSSYTILLITAIATIFSIVVMFFALFHRRVSGAPLLVALAALGAAWGVIYVLELVSRSFLYTQLFDDLQYVPALFMAPVFLSLTMVFTGRNEASRHPSLLLLYVIPTLSVILIATNNAHELFRKIPDSGSLSAGWLQPTQPVHGPWFWVIIAYNIGLMLAALWLLLNTYVRSPRWQRGQVGILLFGAVLFIAATALSIPAWLNNSVVNIPLIALLIGIIVLAYGLLGNRILEVIPVSGSSLLKQLSDGVITLNSRGEILDYNPSAAEIELLDLDANIGKPFAAALQQNAGFTLAEEWMRDHSEEIRLGEKTYDMRISPLIGAASKVVGALVVLRDITQRIRLESERVLIQERYHAIFENTSYSILLLDPQGAILESNDQFTSLAGYTPERCRGSRLGEIIVGAPNVAETALREPFSSGELALLRADGEKIPVELNITPISGSSATAYFIMLQDIRERKRAETTTHAALETVQLRVEELATLRSVTEDLNQATSLRNALLPVLETVKSITRSESIWLYLLGAHASGHQRYEYHPLEEDNLLSSDKLGSRQPKCMTKLMEGKLTYPQLVKECRCSALSSDAVHYAFPLYLGKQPLGVLNFNEDVHTPLNDNKIRLLQTICDSLAVAIERVRLFKSEHDQRRMAETMRDISTALTTSLDLNKVLDLLLDQLSRLVPYDGSTVLQVDEGEAVVARTRGFEISDKRYLKEYQKMRLKIEQTANLERLTSSKRAFIIDDIAQEASFIPSPISADYHCWVGVPIQIDGQIDWFFTLNKLEPAFYTEEHIKLLEVFAVQASLAIKNARLYSAEKTRIKELDGLRATLSDISAQLDVNILLKEIVKRAMRLLNAEVAELGIYDAEGDTIRILVSENFTPDTTGLIVKPGEGLIGRAVITKQAATITHYNQWEGRLKSHEVHNIYSGLAVPMLGGSNEVLGVLNVANIQQKHSFNENDTRLLSLFAQQATVALRNTQLYEEARRRAEEAETIRKAGAVVVSALNQEKTIELILEQLSHVVPYDSAAVLLFTKCGLQIVGGHGFDDFSEVMGLEFSLERTNPGATVYLDNEPKIIGDIVEAAPDFNRYAGSNQPVRSWLGVPLKIQNQPIGILALDSHTKHHFNKEHERMVIAFADQVAIALENARLYEGALQSASRFETLYKLSQVISANIRSDEIYTAFYQATSALMLTEFFGISLLNEGTGMVEDVFMVDHGQPMALSAQPMDQGLYGRVVQTGKSVFYENFTQDLADETGAILVGEQDDESVSQSVMIVPLKIGLSLIGLVSVQSYQPYAHSAQDLEILELLGANVAIAIENARLFSEVQNLAVTDALTGLYNRRKLIELGEPTFQNALRYERELSVVMVDCDDFKLINDTLGHTAGDAALQRLSRVLTDTLRRSDILARYGGDEFMILMPETSASAAVRAAKRLCKNIHQENLIHSENPLRLTISIGVASLDKSCKTLEQLFERADYASYVSKDSGGDQVTRWSSTLRRKRGALKGEMGNAE